MIDPRVATNYNRTDSELEEFLLFTIVVAGKTAAVQARNLDKFLSREHQGSPFQRVQRMIDRCVLRDRLEASKLGQYNRIKRAFTEVIKLDPRTCTVDQLESVHGIGKKTSRYFLVHSRPNLEMAALDTHILQWMGRQGYTVPKSTPVGKKYTELENAFILEAKQRGKTVAELDLEIWNENSRSAKMLARE